MEICGLYGPFYDELGSVLQSTLLTTNTQKVVESNSLTARQWSTYSPVFFSIFVISSERSVNSFFNISSSFAFG